MSSAPKSSVRTRPRRGYAILWVLITLMVLLTFGAFAIELGWLRVAEDRARTASEAAGLAAAARLPFGLDEAAAEATTIASLNEGMTGGVILLADESNGRSDLAFGRWTPEDGFVPGLFAPDAVRTTIRFTADHPNGATPLLLAGLLGVDAVDIIESSTAQWRPRQPVPTSVWLLEAQQPRSLRLRDSRMSVNGGLEVRSDSTDAVIILNDSRLEATQIALPGDYQVDSDDAVFGYHAPQDSASAPPDPPALPLEQLPPMTSPADGVGEHVLPSGFYPEGLVVTSGLWRLDGGLYRFGGPGLSLTQNAELEATNSIIAIDPLSQLLVAEGGRLVATANDSAAGIDNPDRVAIIMLQDGARGGPVTVETGGSLVIDGLLHAPGSRLIGNDGRLVAERLVADQLFMRGGSEVEVGGPIPHPIDLLIVD